MYDDENYEDGFDEAALASSINLNLWGKLFAYAKRYPTELKWLAACAFVTAAMEVTYPLLTKGVIDDVDGYLNGGDNPELMFWGAMYMLCTLILILSIGGFIWMAG